MRLRSLVALGALALVPALTACGSDDKSDGSAVDVTAGNDSCEVAQTEIDAGKTTFAVKNDGSKITEVYVYGQDGDEFTKVISEVENIGPGTSRDMTVTLASGTYEVACKPGQVGDGIRTKIVVDGGAAASESASDGSSDVEGAADPSYDREVELTTDGTSISGLTAGAETGEKVEFTLHNDAAGKRTLEIKDPSGTVVGEAEDVEAGQVGEVVVELGSAGTWKVTVEGEGIEDITADLAVS